MLKHQSVIDKLTRLQKIALVTDPNALSDARIVSLGIPAVNEASLSALTNERKASFESAARSWDEKLVERMAFELSSGASANLVTTPEIKPQVNPRQSGLSEDAYLNGVYASSLVRGIHAAGAACRLAHLSVASSDAEMLDETPNARAIHDLYLAPFLSAEQADAILCSFDGGNYTDCNAGLLRSAARGEFQNAFACSEKTPYGVNLHDLLSGSVCLGGAQLAVERALGRYRQIKEYVKEGSATERELSGAVEEGSALSEESLDAAVDKIIEFAYQVNGYVPKPVQTLSEETLLEAARKSVVLLKNERILPLETSARVAIIGEAFEGFSERVNVAAQAQGYRINADRSEELIPDAVKAAANADVIFLFLRHNPNEETLSLPANRRALIAALKKTGKRMIAILDQEADMQFDADFSAVLLAQDAAYSGRALAEIVKGEIYPSGRLTRSLYDGADALFSSLKADKEEGRTPVGTFVGYRYYDTLNMKVRYPFGFGLGYTKFHYSDLAVEGGTLSFTLKNTGSVAGRETVQVYVGKKKPSYASPKKELKAFTSVELQAGQSKRVSLPLPQEAFLSFDECTLTSCVEEGEYTVFVGASVSDTRLRKTLKLEGVRREKTADESGKKSNAKSIRKPRYSGWEPIAFFALLAALVGVLAQGMYIGDKLGYYGLPAADWLLLSLFIVLAVAFAAVLITARIKRAKRLKEEVKRGNEDAKLLKMMPEELFEQKFAQEAEAVATTPSEPQYFDEEMTFASIAEDMQKFFSERGLRVSVQSLRWMLAAFTSSRILAVPQSQTLKKFFDILAEYFGTDLYCDIAQEDTAYSVYRRNSFFARRTNFARACQEAKWKGDRIHLGLVLHANAETAQEILSAVSSGMRGAGLPVPPNLWTVIGLEDGFAGVPETVARALAFVDLEMTECASSEEKTLCKAFGYQQFTHLKQRVRNAFPLKERYYQCVDRLEATACRIENTAWIRLELCASTMLACGSSEREAVDAAVATGLLVRFSALPNGSNGLLKTLEQIFGAEEIPLCRKVLDRIKKEGGGRTV